MPLPLIYPPLINSANPWATTKQDLQALFDCPHTGAVTTRTCLWSGFDHQDSIHQYTFFDTASHSSLPGRSINKNGDTSKGNDATIPPSYNATLNTLGYSPISIQEYLDSVKNIVSTSTAPHAKMKPFIISVTGAPDDVGFCYNAITALQRVIPNPLCMELNLSCPNIPDAPPPAYSTKELTKYLNTLAQYADVSKEIDRGAAVHEASPPPSVIETAPEDKRRVAIGLKVPPYTHIGQFRALLDALLDTPACRIDFITAVNTLGSSLLLVDRDGGNGSIDRPPRFKSAIPSATGTGIGGLAGAVLHPLALGNVRTIRSLLEAEERLRGVDVIGVGGVEDRGGFERMRAVGADIVGVGSALGREGLGVFRKILEKREGCAKL